MTSHRPPFTSIVEELPPTVPFVAPETLERARGRPFRARLGANESAFGMSPRTSEAMAAAVQHAWHYGDPECHELRVELARVHGIGVENIVVGSGIDELLGLVVRLFLEPGGVAVASLGSYPTFHYHVTGHGGPLERVPYHDERNDLHALADAARKRHARIAYLANPDNPTGTWHTAADVARFLDALPSGCLFLLDEAYAEFAPPDALPPMDVSDPRLLRCRTFSKAYGMAGARIGYAVAHADIIAAFQKVRNHFGVNHMAQAGALAALREADFLADVVRRVEEGREHYHRIGREMGLPTLPSATNFVAFNAGGPEAARALLNQLAERDVFVRMPVAPPLDRFIRVTVGPPAERAIFEEALRAISA